MKKIFDKLLQIFAAGTNVAYTGMDANGDYDPSKAGTINTNTGAANAGDAGNLSPEMKTFYSKALIRLAGPNLVHDQFGQKRPIPKGNGRTIEFRQFSTLPKALKKLTEGVTPIGNKMSVSKITATVDQYGDYIEETDLLQLTAYDDTIGEDTRALADQAGRTLDTVTRNVLNAGYNVYYCPKVSGGTETEVKKRSDLDATAMLRVKDVFRAATILKNVNAQKIGDSYVAIIHPSVAHDLMIEAGVAWIDVTKYTDLTPILNGEIGKLGGVRFVESTEAKVFAPEAIADGLNRLHVKTASTASTSLVVEEKIATQTPAEAIEVYVKGVKNTVTAITAGSEGDNGYTGTTLTLGTAATCAVGDMVCGTGAAPDGSAVFSTLFIAKNAYGVTDIEGGGLQHVFKGLGQNGNDPLNQRSSIGWKATKTAVILTEAYLLRVESCSSFSDTAEEN